MHMYTSGLGKGFLSLNIHLFGADLKLNFSLQSFVATPSLMFAHLHFCNLNALSIMWVCSRKVDTVLLAASVSFLSPVMLDTSRNSDRNKSSTCYKAVLEASYSQSM